MAAAHIFIECRLGQDERLHDFIVVLSFLRSKASVGIAYSPSTRRSSPLATSI